MSSQPQVAKLAPDLIRGVTSLARTLVAASRPPANAQVPEAAEVLHDRDLLRLTFSGGVRPQAVSKLLHLLVVMRSSPFTVRHSPLDERSTEDGKR